MKFYRAFYFGLAFNFVIFTGSALAVDATSIPDPRDCAPLTSGFDFSLRTDFIDLGPLNCPHNFFSAQGATLSLSDNLLTRVYSGSLNGLAATSYRYYGDERPLVGYAVGGFVQANDMYQFNPTMPPANSDTVTSGGYGEIAFINPLMKYPAAVGMDDFRVRGGDVTSSTGTTSQTFVGEWLPAYSFGRYANFGLPNEVGNTAFFYTLAPELMVQDDHYASGPNKFLIFASRSEALRMGPQVSLQLVAFRDWLPKAWPAPLQDFLGNSALLLTNHESRDVYTGKGYTWTLASWTYTFPKLPSLGVTGSYGYGNSEATGNRTSQFMLGLAGKFEAQAPVNPTH